MEAVIAMTAKLQLPPSLRERIHEYYEHLWHEYECLDGEIVQFSKELSHTLGLEVVLFKYMELVMHVPFWKDCTPDFQKQLMLRLDVRVYLPNDFIMREGEVDDEFYMVNRGYCELSRVLHRFERVSNTIIGAPRSSNPGFSTSRTNGRMTSRMTRRRSSGIPAVNLNDIHHQSAYELDPSQRRYYSSSGRRAGRAYELMITRGQAFGDLALLMNYQRAANVRAITHVEMCVLSRESFQAVLTRYPDDRCRVVMDMLTSYMQSYEASQSRCPMLELVRKVYSAEAITEACVKAGMSAPLLPPLLTARQAAERIYTAINVEMQDATLKFGVGANIREQLVELRERRRQKHQAGRHPRSILRQDEHLTTLKKDVVRSSDCVKCASAVEANNSIPQVAPSQTGVQPNHDKADSSLQVRLHQVEEREVAILRALQELKTSFTIFRDRQSTPVVASSAPVVHPQTFPSSKERSLPESGAPIGLMRPKLLQRMGSLMGLSSGNTAENRDQQQDVKASPTHYADQLFQATTSASSSHVPIAQQLPNDCSPPKLIRASTFSLVSERSPRLDTSETSTSMLFNPSDTPSALTTNCVEIKRGYPGQRLVQRTHSQNLHRLAEGATSYQGRGGSVGTSSTPPARLLSPAVAEPRESPTRYADALFRPRVVGEWVTEGAPTNPEF